MAEQPLQPLQRRLTLPDARAVGGPVALRLLAAYFGLSLVGWLAAAAALIAAAPRLSAGDLGATAPVLTVHLLALGFLPLAVSGGSFHLLPVMLRNPLRSELRLWVALPLLAVGAWLTAPGVAYDIPAVLWPGAALLASGLALVLLELGRLAAGAPRGRMLVASRTGVALSLFHALAALVLGAIVFDHGDAPMLGVGHGRWLLVHLHLAVLGWLALLILTVGRTLGPMLALAPAAAPRRLPLEELVLTLGLWLLVAGIAADTTPLAYIGALLVLLALGRFATLIARIGRTRRIEPEGPLLHLLAGALFLAEAAILGPRPPRERRAAAAWPRRVRTSVAARLGRRRHPRPPAEASLALDLGLVAARPAPQAGCPLSAPARATRGSRICGRCRDHCDQRLRR